MAYTVVSIKPRSILQLTIAGFLSVTGLLFIALLITARQLDGLGERNFSLMNEMATALNLGRTLTELTTALERNARQYNVLKNRDILALYEERQATFHAAAAELGEIQDDAALQSLIADIRLLERQAYGRLEETASAEIEQLYGEILLVSNRIATAINDWSNNRVSAIIQETEATQQLLTVQAFVLVGAALLLAAVFTALITRPLLQVKKAIGQLGSGQYEDDIHISGPSDLVSLGERLDWLRSRLAGLEQQRSSFIRHVSHELKTPLAAIQESASLLEDGVVGELAEKQKQVIDIQISNIRRLQHLIDELLRHHLASFSVINTMPEQIRLDELLEEVINRHQVTIEAARIEVTKELTGCTMLGNRDQIRVALDNLMSNAVKYTPPGGSVGVKVEAKADQMVITVQDSGPGISEDQADRIFDAFYQGPPPDRNVYRGSGLGLAIAREYVDNHGGSIGLQPSESGACFCIMLPRKGGKNGQMEGDKLD